MAFFLTHILPSFFPANLVYNSGRVAKIMGLARRKHWVSAGILDISAMLPLHSLV
jgi:hypothetical protein